MKRILWFSRFPMSNAQERALREKLGEEVTIVQDFFNLNDFTDLHAKLENIDVFAANLPAGMKMAASEWLNRRGILYLEAFSDRIRKADKFVFQFNRWERVLTHVDIRHDVVDLPDDVEKVLLFTQHFNEMNEKQRAIFQEKDVEILDVTVTDFEKQLLPGVLRNDAILAVASADLLQKLFNAKDGRPLLMAAMQVVEGKQEFLRWEEIDDFLHVSEIFCR